MFCYICLKIFFWIIAVDEHDSGSESEGVLTLAPTIFVHCSRVKDTNYAVYCESGYASSHSRQNTCEWLGRGLRMLLT